MILREWIAFPPRRVIINHFSNMVCTGQVPLQSPKNLLCHEKRSKEHHDRRLLNYSIKCKRAEASEGGGRDY